MKLIQILITVKYSMMSVFKCALFLGLDDLITKISSTPLNKEVHIQARHPVLLPNSVLIENIPMSRCTEDWLEMYFTNRNKSGIESYKGMQILENGKVVVHLESKDGKINIFCSNFTYVYT